MKKIFTVDLTVDTYLVNCQIDGDFFNFSGLLRKHELYSKLQINERVVKVKEEYNGMESILKEHTYNT